MKKQVKGFGQFVNEGRLDQVEGMSRGGSISLVDLLDCYVETNHPNGEVLVMVDISNQAMDLVDGGIEVIVDPNERSIGQAQWDGTYYSELYRDGRRVGEEDFYGTDEDFGLDK